MTLPPEGGREDDEQREELEPPEQHRRGAEPGLEVGEDGVGRGRSDLVEPRAHVVDAGHHRRERGDEVEPARGHHQRHADDRQAVDEHERQHGEDQVVLDRLTADLQRHLGARVEDPRELAQRRLQQHQRADHLHPAAGRPGRGREAAEVEHQQRRERRPLVEVGVGEPGRARDRDDVERGEAQRLPERLVEAGMPQIDRDQRGRPEHREHHHAGLGIARIRPGAAPTPREEVGREVEARDQHEDDGHGLDRRRVPEAEARVVRREPAEAHGRERVDDRVEPRHAGELHRQRCRRS